MSNNIIVSNTICVLLLENTLLFLYPLVRDYADESEIMIECALYYDYPKKHRPIKVVEMIVNKTIHDIDTSVIHYMLLYGMDHVRGGNYFEEVLPEYKQKMLADLLDFNSVDNLDNINAIHKLIEKYKNINVSEIPGKIEHLNKMLERYKREFENLEKFRYVDDESKIYRIDNMIFKDIEWMRIICNNRDESVILSKQSKDIYRRIIVLFKKLTMLYSTFNDSLKDKMDEYVFLKYPDFLFDKFIYHPNYQTINHHDLYLVDNICDKFKYITCFILNRIDEFMYDVHESYGYNCKTDWIIPKEIFYLQQLLEKHHSPLNENAENPDTGVGL